MPVLHASQPVKSPCHQSGNPNNGGNYHARKNQEVVIDFAGECAQVGFNFGIVQRYQLPRVTLEGNGVGKFAPAVLKGALRQRKLQCGVTEVTSTDNKNKRILESLEPLLLANRQLWAHVDVLNGPLWDQMKDWNPALRNQADDYLDAAAGAVSETPERIQRAGNGWIAPSSGRSPCRLWRPCLPCGL